MVKFTSIKTSQILEATNAAQIHSCLCDVILFYESKIIMQIVTFCSGVNEVSIVLVYDASHWVIIPEVSRQHGGLVLKALNVQENWEPITQ